MSFIPYDQRDGFIWMDGALVPWRDANIHVLTHGLHYGSGVFEGARIYDGEVFASTQHSERLHASAKILGFEIPYTVAAARPGLPGCHQGARACRRLSSAPSLGAARKKWASRRRMTKIHVSGRLLGLGLLLPDGRAAEGHPLALGGLSPARSQRPRLASPRQRAST